MRVLAVFLLFSIMCSLTAAKTRKKFILPKNFNSTKNSANGTLEERYYDSYDYNYEDEDYLYTTGWQECNNGTCTNGTYYGTNGTDWHQPDIVAAILTKLPEIVKIPFGWMRDILGLGSKDRSIGIYQALSAARHGNKNSVALYLDNHDVNDADRNGFSLLHNAAKFGQFEMMNYLINRTANVTAQDNYGNTPLHWAVMRNHTEGVKILLDNNADPYAENNYGYTPIDESSSYGYSNIYNLLKKEQ